MTILAMRTDKPVAEIYLYDADKLLKTENWQAHRQLSVTIHTKIEELLKSVGQQIQDISGLIFYQGPGSFTGLRIGISVANALGSSLNVPIVATQGDNWQQNGLKMLKGTINFRPVEPFYGSDAHITLPKK